MGSANSQLGRVFHQFALELTVGSECEACFELTNNGTGAAPRCPICGRPIGPLRKLPPHEVRLTTFGKIFPDFVLGPGLELLFTRGFLSLLQGGNFGGLSKLEQVKSLDVRGSLRDRDPPEYIMSHAVLSFNGRWISNAKTVACTECGDGGYPVPKRGSLNFPSHLAPDEDLCVSRGAPGRLLFSSELRSKIEQQGLCGFHFR